MGGSSRQVIKNIVNRRFWNTMYQVLESSLKQGYTRAWSVWNTNRDNGNGNNNKKNSDDQLNAKISRNMFKTQCYVMIAISLTHPHLPRLGLIFKKLFENHIQCFLHSTFLTVISLSVLIYCICHHTVSSTRGVVHDVCSPYTPSTQHNVCSLNKYLLTILWICDRLKSKERNKHINKQQTPEAQACLKAYSSKWQRQDLKPGLCWLSSLCTYLLFHTSN